jgi:hypothetical protein
MLQHRNGHAEPPARTFPPYPLAALPRLDDPELTELLADTLPPGLAARLHRVCRQQARSASTEVARIEAARADRELSVVEDALALRWRERAEPEGWWQHVRPAQRRWAMPDNLTLMAFTAAVSGLVGWLVVVMSGR